MTTREYDAGDAARLSVVRVLWPLVALSIAALSAYAMSTSSTSYQAAIAAGLVQQPVGGSYVWVQQADYLPWNLSYPPLADGAELSALIESWQKRPRAPLPAEAVK